LRSAPKLSKYLESNTIERRIPMVIKVLGSGCMNCQTLERRTHDALQALHLEAVVEKVTDLEGITSYGVMRTPGLVINERVVSQGSVPTVEKIQQLILAEKEKASAL
jgi:small redox-active disulfide protein 2